MAPHPVVLLRKDNKNVKKRINDVARAIRKKYLALKLERSEEDKALSKLLNPITDPLNKLVKRAAATAVEDSAQKPPSHVYKIETKLFPTVAVKHETHKNRPKDKLHETESAANDDDNDDDDNNNNDDQNFAERDRSYLENLEEQYPEIAREYVHKFWNRSGDIDFIYGFKHDMDTGTWTIGTKVSDFLANGDIRIGDITYEGTRGLYDLLFLNSPSRYNAKDEKQYKEILEQTNVYRRNFDPTGQIKGSSSAKYRDIIKRLVKPTTRIRSTPRISLRSSSSSKSFKRKSKSTGSGFMMMQYNEKPKQYVYYDDVNELIDRLFILDASHEAGNGNHINEIQSILEELRELGVIIY